jgi:methyl-accepting chemotaxis protein
LAIADELNEKFGGIMKSLGRLAELEDRIAAAAGVQNENLGRINQDMVEMDRQSGEIVAESDSMARVSGQISEHVETLRKAIDLLGAMANRRA